MSALYHHERLDVYECMGCGAFLETPSCAVLKAGHRAVHVKMDPENRLLWLELMEMDHAACVLFHDAKMAEEARQYRRRTVVRPRGDDGPGSYTKPAAQTA